MGFRKKPLSSLSLSVSLSLSFAPAPRALAGKKSVPWTVQRGGRTRETRGRRERKKKEPAASGGNVRKKPASSSVERRSREADGDSNVPPEASCWRPLFTSLPAPGCGGPRTASPRGAGAGREGARAEQEGGSRGGRRKTITMRLLFSLVAPPSAGSGGARKRKREGALSLSLQSRRLLWVCCCVDLRPRRTQGAEREREGQQGAAKKAAVESRREARRRIEKRNRQKTKNRLSRRAFLYSPGSRGVLCWLRGLRAAGGGRCLLRNRYQRGSNQPEYGEGT